MSEQAKTLLAQIRGRNRQTTDPFQALYGHGMSVVRIGSSSPFDEMLELYIAAREDEDQTNLRKERDKLKAELAEARSDSSDRLKKQREAERERNRLKLAHDQTTKFLAHLIRTNDILVVYNVSEHLRQKVTAYDFNARVVTLVNWDQRRKTWAKTEHTKHVSEILPIVSIERPEDKENTKAKKKKRKRGK